MADWNKNKDYPDLNEDPGGENVSSHEEKSDGKPLDNREVLKKLLPLIKSFALWFLFVIIVHLPGIKDPFRDFVVGFTTQATYLTGKILFLPIERIGFASIMVDGYPMEIIVECTAYNFYLFVIALALFANWSWRDKLINLLIFFGIIFFVNNLRFFAMGYIGRYYPDLFDTTHDYIWNILFGFLIFGVWIWRDRKSNPDLKKVLTDHEAKENH